MFKILLIYLILINVILYSKENNPPWLAEVESTYEDEVTGEPVKVHGTAFLFSWKSWNGKVYYFALVNSHVGAGKMWQKDDKYMPTLTIQGKKLRWDKTYATVGDGNADLLLVAIPDPHISDKRMPTYDFEQKKISIPYNEVSKYLPQISKCKEKTEEYFVPILSGLMTNSMSSKNCSLNSDRQVKGTICDEALSPIPIAPGMSGSPIVKCDPNSKQCFVEGITKRRERFFDVSYFVGNAHIKILIDTFFTSFRTRELSDSRWVARNGLIFRTWENGSEVRLKN